MADFDDKPDKVQDLGVGSGKSFDQAGKPHNMTRKLNDLISPLGALKVGNQTPVIELKSTYGISNIRDITSESNSGAVTNNQVRYLLSTGNTSGSSAKLRSAIRGRYVAGTSAIAGLGIRVPEIELTGDEQILWGYYDDDNGFRFGKDADGLFVEIVRAGSTRRVYRQNWNRDTLDGSNIPSKNPSGFRLDPKDGAVFRIFFDWYGFGDGKMRVLIGSVDENRDREMHTVHVFSEQGQSSTENPNLPLTAEVKNGSTTTDVQLEVYGRQFHILGEYNPPLRRTDIIRVNQAIGTTFEPIMSYRYQDSNKKSIEVNISRFAFISDTDLIVKVLTGTSLTGASWTSPTDIPSDETAVEIDKSATDYTGASRKLGQTIVSTGQGSKRSNFDRKGLKFIIPEDDIVTLAARGIDASGTTTTNLSLEEEW